MKHILVSLIFLFTLSCQKQVEELPILSYKINDAGKKTYYSITYTDFTNQFGETFTTANIKDKIVVANFFFTKCPSICPPMRNQLIKLAESLTYSNEILLVSHTIDPINDTTEVLRNYAESTNIHGDLWQFIRSTETHTKQQARQFMTNFKANEDGTDFYHSSYVTLVDKNQQIRGFYNILVDEDVQRLKEDISQLQR